MGRGKNKGKKKGGRWGWESAAPWGVGGNYGGCKASRVDPEPHGVEWEEGDCEASGVEENPGRGRHGVGGWVELSPDNSTRH